jgi:hypothetical protein
MQLFEVNAILANKAFVTIKNGAYDIMVLVLNYGKRRFLSQYGSDMFDSYGGLMCSMGF